MEGDGSNLPSNAYSEFLADNVEGFQEFIEEAFEAIDQDETFNEMTAKSYMDKKFYIKSHLWDLSLIHDMLAFKFIEFVLDVSNQCPHLLQNQHLSSSDSTSPQTTHRTATGIDITVLPGGGTFHLSEGKGSKNSAMSSDNKPAVGLLSIEGDTSNLPSTTKHEYFERLADNVERFLQFINEGVEAIRRDQNFNGMTADSYVEKKFRVKSHFLELSLIHNSLADQFANLIKEVGKHCPSMLQNQHIGSSTSIPPQYTEPKFGKPTGFHVLSRGKRSSYSASESSMASVNKPPIPRVSDDVLKAKDKDHSPESALLSMNKPLTLSPVNDDALKVEETKESGIEFFISCFNKPAILPQVNDDASNVEKIRDHGSESSPMDDDALKAEETKYSLSESFMSFVKDPEVAPVNDDFLKVVETQDSGSESSMLYVNKPPAPPVSNDALMLEEFHGPESSMLYMNNPPVFPTVNDDASKVEETKDIKVLLEKISNLEKELVSLKQKHQS